MRLPYGLREGAGRLIRKLRLPIRSGPNHGLRWSLASSGRGYLSGRFEPARVESFLALVRPGDTVWDVGAHKGYLSLAFARTVGPEGRVVAVEPSRMNQWFLERHIRWNDIRNVDRVKVALSDTSGEDLFGGAGSTLAFQLGRGDETVRVATIAELVERDGCPPPDVVKIDTEGSEAEVIAGGRGVLGPASVLLVAIHGREECRDCLELLRDLGYRLHPSASMRVRLDDPDLPWGGDQDLIAVGPERGVEPATVEALPLVAGG